MIQQTSRNRYIPSNANNRLVQSSNNKQLGKQMYDYLLMRFLSKKLHQHRRNIGVNDPHHPQLKFTPDLNPHCHESVLSLFVCQPESKCIIDTIPAKWDYNKKYSQSQSVFVSRLLEYYPQLLSTDKSQNQTQKRKRISEILCLIIEKESILSIYDQFGMSLQIQDFIQKSKENDHIEFFINGVIFKQQDTGSQTLQIAGLNLKLNQIIQKVFAQSIIPMKNQNQIPRIIQIMKIISQVIANRIGNMKYFILQNKNAIKDNLMQSFRQFSLVYKSQFQLVNNNIFELHHVEQILAATYLIQHRENNSIAQNNFGSNHCLNSKLNIINLFNYVKVDGKSTFRINEDLLRLFLKLPYQTSLLVLYRLLQNSHIKDVKKIFLFSKGQKFIDPLLFLLVDKSLINYFNSQIFSLSLWIVIDVWLKFTENAAKSELQNLSAKSIKQQKTTAAQFVNSERSGNNTQASPYRDPRRIYSFRQETYQSIPPNGLPKYELVSSLSKVEIFSLKDLQTKYKRPLMYTITMFLLTLDFQTTFLKYFPIENDLIKEMVQGDLLPTLLTDNKYLFNKSHHVKTHQLIRKNYNQKCQQTRTFEELLIRNIQMTQNMEQLQNLEKQLQKYQEKTALDKRQNQDQLSENFLSNYTLPWMGLIQSKNILFQLILKPSGFKLALKILQCHPYTFQKTYDSFIPKLIFAQIEQNSLLFQPNQKDSKNKYLLKGNRNVKCNKKIDYSSRKQIKQEPSNKKAQQNLADLENKMQVWRQILTIYKQKGKDEMIRKVCIKFLSVI